MIGGKTARAKQRRLRDRTVLVAAFASGTIAIVSFSLQEAYHLPWPWYFSTISSALLAITAAVFLLRIEIARPQLLQASNATAAMCLLSAIVYFAVIVPANGLAVFSDPWSVIDNFTLHVSSPLLALAVLSARGPSRAGPLQKHLSASFVIPALYLALLLTARWWGWIPEVPYLFLSVAEFGVPRVLLHVGVLLFLYSLCATLVWFSLGRIARRHSA